MSFMQCEKMAEQMDVAGITIEKLEIASVVRETEEVVLNTNSGSIAFLGAIIDNGEERESFADGNSTHDAAEISAKTFWEWKGDIYVAQMIRSFSYGCSGHSGGVDDCSADNCVKFSWNRFDDQHWQQPERVESLPEEKWPVIIIFDNDIDEIISFVSFALSDSEYNSDRLSKQDIPQVGKKQSKLTKRLLAICSKIDEN